MESLKREIIECIQVSGNATFADLHERFGDRFEGEYTMFTSPDSNIVLWDEISDRFINAIGQLLAEEKITVRYEPDTVQIYAMKGAVLPYPLMRQPLESGQGALCWLPVVMNAKRD
jgi:hypothetical protein